jgi:predicted restriction endonuclease
LARSEVVASTVEGVSSVLGGPRQTSHIIPWNNSKENRLNPRNGLCLSVLHDKAFDRGLISVFPDLTICISPQLKKLKNDKFIQSAICRINGNKITPPEKFRPSPEFLTWHNENVFLS